jgi:hypothetical protein
MNLYPKKAPIFIFIICCALLLMVGMFPAQATAKRSHTLPIALFASGMVLKFGGAFVENSAQDSYDQYLNTAIQADIAKHRDAYTSKHNASVVMSRVGIGFVGVATLVSLLNQFDLISHQPTALRLAPSYDFLTHETTFLLQRRF